MKYVLLFMSFFELLSCGSRGKAIPDYVTRGYSDGVNKIYILHRPYRGFSGIGMCGNWTSYKSGERVIKIIVPSGTNESEMQCVMEPEELDFTRKIGFGSSVARIHIVEDMITLVIGGKDGSYETLNISSRIR